MNLVHQHEENRVQDPINGHEWVICSCGFALDLHVLRGKSA